MLSKNQIKELQSLQLKKFRDAGNLFIAEGVKTVTEILQQAPDLIYEVYATPVFLQAHSAVLLKEEIKFTEVNTEELKKISLQVTPNEVFALCRYFKAQQPDVDLKKEVAFYLDDIRDPGNLGTILRLADWFGMKHVFCSPASCDVYNPKVIQSSMGAFLRVSCIYTELSEITGRYAGTPVYGAVLNGSDLYKEKLQHGLIVIGNEANGIQEKNLELVTKKLTIPASNNNGTESLNAAMAASIIVSEFFRQLRDR